MELGVEAGHAEAVVRIGRRVHLLEQRPSSGRELSDRCCTQRHNLATGQVLQRQANLQDFLQPIDVDAHQPHATIALVDDDALTLQQAQRLAHRNPADIQRAGNFRLDDPVAGQEDALRGGLDNGVDDLIDQGLGERRSCRGLS